MADAPLTLTEFAPELPTSSMIIVGEDDRPLDTRTVAITVAVRANFKIGDRDFSHHCMMHEYATMKRYYEGARGGSIELQPYWAPGVPRYRELTQDELKRELERMRRTYIIPRPGGQIPVLCFDEFFGAQPSEQLKRLHKAMREQLAAWNTLLVTARGRVDRDPRMSAAVRESLAYERMTPRELEAIAQMTDPSKQGLDDVVLPTVAMPGEGSGDGLDAQLAGADPNADARLDRALAALEAAGFGEKALPLIQLLESVGTAAKMTNDEITRVVGSAADADRIRLALTGV